MVVRSALLGLVIGGLLALHVALAPADAMAAAPSGEGCRYALDQNNADDNEIAAAPSDATPEVQELRKLRMAIRADCINRDKWDWYLYHCLGEGNDICSHGIPTQAQRSRFVQLIGFPDPASGDYSPTPLDYLPVKLSGTDNAVKLSGSQNLVRLSDLQGADKGNEVSCGSCGGSSAGGSSGPAGTDDNPSVVRFSTAAYDQQKADQKGFFGQLNGGLWFLGGLLVALFCGLLLWRVMSPRA